MTKPRKSKVQTQEVPVELFILFGQQLAPFVRRVAADSANPLQEDAAALVARYDEVVCRILTALGGKVEMVPGQGPRLVRARWRSPHASQWQAST